MVDWKGSQKYKEDQFTSKPIENEYKKIQIRISNDIPNSITHLGERRFGVSRQRK
jgi:hypothetical protein